MNNKGLGAKKEKIRIRERKEDEDEERERAQNENCAEKRMRNQIDRWLGYYVILDCGRLFDDNVRIESTLPWAYFPTVIQSFDDNGIY